MNGAMGRNAFLRNRLFIFAALVCVCLPVRRARAQEDDPRTTDTAVVQGNVTNEVTGEGIGRALVFSPDNRFATLTDGQGHFQFTVPKPKPSNSKDAGVFSFGGRAIMSNGDRLYTFQARKPGFVEHPYGPEMVAPGESVTIGLLPEAIIKGRVMSLESDGAAGIPVELFMRQVVDGKPRWNRAQSASANSSGEFRFADLLPGAYKVMTREQLDTDPAVFAPGAQLYGFPPVCFPGVSDFGSGTTIQLGAGQTFQADIPVARQPYFPVHIAVTNSTEVGGMNVRVLAQGHPGPGYSLGYNPQSRRIEGLLPKGSYLVEASSFGDGPGSGGGSVNITVAGPTMTAPTMTIVPSALIPVNVTEQFNSTNWQATSSFSEGPRSFTFRNGPRTYLNISLQPADDFSEGGYAGLRRPLSPNDSALVIENAQPGRYWVRVQSARGYVASVTSGSVDLLHEPLTVPAGGGVQIDVTMRDDSAKLDGTVTGLRNTTATGIGSQGRFVNAAAYVYCVPVPDSTGQFEQIGVAQDGKFSSDKIAPGSYRVLAFQRPQPALPYRDAEAMRVYDSQGQVVHLVAGQAQHLELQLSQGEK